MNLKCISLNIRGINKSIKRRNLFRWLRNGKCDVIFLQETYSDKNIENVWRSEWGGDVFYSHGSKHSRGVMVLIKPTLKIEDPEIIRDKSGRFLIVRATLLDEDTVLLISTLRTTQVFKNPFLRNYPLNCVHTPMTILFSVVTSTVLLKVLTK